MSNKTKERTKGEWYSSPPKISEVANGQTYFSIQVKYPETRTWGDGERTYVNVGFYYPHSIQTPEEMEANANFICLAANQHDTLVDEKDKLVKVLRMAVKKYEDELTNPFCIEWFKQAKQLLESLT